MVTKLWKTLLEIQFRPRITEAEPSSNCEHKTLRTTGYCVSICENMTPRRFTWLTICSETPNDFHRGAWCQILSVMSWSRFWKPGSKLWYVVLSCINWVIFSPFIYHFYLIQYFVRPHSTLVNWTNDCNGERYGLQKIPVLQFVVYTEQSKLILVHMMKSSIQNTMYTCLISNYRVPGIKLFERKYL